MSRLREDSGMSVIELLAGILGFVVIFGAIMEMTIVATHNQDRIAQRVAADQRARPTLTRIMDGLHSACVAQRVAPIAPGSTSNSITFISKSGSAVSPVPDRRVLTLTGGNLTEQVYPATGGAPPVWTFSGTPTTNRTLLTNVTAPAGGAFRYFRYVNGQLSTTPLPVPLSSTDASRTAHVTVSLTVQPGRGVSSQDTNSPITLTNSADLLLESASQVSAQENFPCT